MRGTHRGRTANLTLYGYTLHPLKFSSRKNGLQMMIDNLRHEIEEYDALKQQQTPIKIASIQELPIALIRARIAMGMTQKELAEKMGVKEQQDVQKIPRNLSFFQLNRAI